MNATVNGAVSNIQSGDAVTIIEIVWKLGDESEATAQTNGRGWILTSYADRAALSAAMTAAGNSLSAGITDSFITYGAAGITAIADFQAAGYAVSSANIVLGNSYIPAIRVTESRSGAGAWAGAWTVGALFGAMLDLTFDAETAGTTVTTPFVFAGAASTRTYENPRSASQGTGKVVRFTTTAATYGEMHYPFTENITKGYMEFGIAWASNASRYALIGFRGKDAVAVDVDYSVYAAIYNNGVIANAPVLFKVNSGVSGGQFQISGVNATDDFNLLNEFKIAWDLTTPATPVWNFYKKITGTWTLMTNPADVTVPTVWNYLTRLMIHTQNTYNVADFDYIKIVKES